MGLSKLFYKDTHIALLKRGEQFVLSLRYADKPASLGDILDRWPELGQLGRYFANKQPCEADIGIHQLEDARQLMSDMEATYGRKRKLVFYVQPEVRRIHVQNVQPEGFCLTYLWKDRALHRVNTEGAVELPGGWYRLGDIYWQYPALNRLDRQRIRRVSIEKQEFLEFLQRDLPAYTAAGVRCACGLAYSATPALMLTIQEAGTDRVQIRGKWNVPPERIDADFDLDGYVIEGRTLRPGIRPGMLAGCLPFDQGRRLLLHPWLGTRKLDTLGMLLRTALREPFGICGIRPLGGGLGLEVQPGPEAGGFPGELTRLLSSVDEADISLESMSLTIDRYDFCVPRELLEKAYRQNWPDISGLRTALAEGVGLSFRE